MLHARTQNSCYLALSLSLARALSLSPSRTHTGMPVTSYRIYQRRQDEPIFSAIKDVSVDIGGTGGGGGGGTFAPLMPSKSRMELSATIGSTTAGYSYQYKISAITKAGEGPLSEVSARAVSPLLPSMPTPTVVFTYPEGFQENGATAFVSWPVAPASFAALGYSVQLQDRFIGPDAPFDRGVNVNRLNHSFVNLTLGKLFAFRVQALSDVNDIRSNTSDVVVVETRDLRAPTSVKSSLYGDRVPQLQIVWSAPLQSNDVESYQVFRVDQKGTITMTVAAKSASMILMGGAAGSTYKVSVQARFVGGLGSRVSLWSEAVMLPTTVPVQMDTPTLEVDPQLAAGAGCNTCLLARFRPLLSSLENGGADVLEYEVVLYADKSGTEESKTVAADKLSWLFTNLERGGNYRVKARAGNVNGYSITSGYSSPFRLPTTLPDTPTNLRLVPETFAITAITIEWDPAPSGNLEGLKQYRLFKLSIENDLDDGTIFKMAETIGGQGTRYHITNLRGGVEYVFKLMAINTDNKQSVMSAGVVFVAGEVEPLAVKTMRSEPTKNPDLLSHYLLRLYWTIPTLVDETGGAPILNFRLQYTTEESADFDPVYAQWCTTKSGRDTEGQAAPCDTADVGVNADGMIGLVNELDFAVVKGTIYHFRIAAINKIGQGPWSSTSSVGTLKTPRYITAPSQPPAPSVVPKTKTNMDIEWTDYDKTCTSCYENRRINGGRPLTHLELQIKVNHGPWFQYGQAVTNVPSCGEAAGGDCIFNHWIVPWPEEVQKGILRQRDLNFQRKKIAVNPFTMNQKGFYEFRLRSSNDNMTSWSPWSKTGSGTTFLDVFQNVQVSGFPHEFGAAWRGMPTPTTMELRWYGTPFVPANLKPTNARVFFGYTYETVRLDQPAITYIPTFGFDLDASRALVSELIPDTVYHFKVLGVSEQGEQLNVTLSNATGLFYPARTAIGKPSRAMKVEVYKSPVLEERVAGFMYVEWSPLPPHCTTGYVMADGSISGCPRGRQGNLASYNMYVRLETETYSASLSRKYETDFYENLVIVKGLQKGKMYCFSVAAANTNGTGDRSDENCTEAVRTPPGPPPAPTSPAASLSALRVSITQPEDVGAYDGVIEKMVLHMTPGRDGANESFLITWQRSIVVTGLTANTYFLFTVQARNNKVDMWSEHSSTLYAKTTSHAPTNVRQRSPVAETNSVDLVWDLPAPAAGQGNVAINGYRVQYRALQNTLGMASGSQLCSISPVGGGCRVSNLSAGTRYEFKVGACTDAALLSSFGPISDPVELKTAVKLPTISQPQVSGLDLDSAIVSWKVDNGGLPILATTLYTKLEIEPLDAGLVVDLSLQDQTLGAVQQIRVRGLGPALEYRFLVKVSNSLGESTSLLSDPITTLAATVETPMVRDPRRWTWARHYLQRCGLSNVNGLLTCRQSVR